MDSTKYLFEFLVKKGIINKEEFDIFVEEMKENEDKESKKKSDEHWDSVKKMLDSGRNIRGDLGI